MDEAEKLCDRLAIIDHGKIIAEGSPEELIERLGGHHVLEIVVANDGKAPLKPTEGLNGAPESLWKSLPGVQSIRHEDGTIALQVYEPHETIPALLAAIQQHGSKLEHLTTRQASLEDVFVQLTGRHLREG
jgi:ABC-2 type transport system ATP-binding protein